MLSMFAMAASRSLPMVSAEGSLKRCDSGDCRAGAGEGVAGGFCGADDECEGAAGAAGVCAAAGAGVDGAALLDEGAVVFGWGEGQYILYKTKQRTARTRETMQTTKPFSSML
jgi:hypothetical protein